MAITNVDDIATALTSSQDFVFVKNFTAPKAAGAFQSGWLATGFPGAGVASPAYTAGSGYTCSSATAGGVPFTNGAVKLWLAQAAMSCSQPGTLILADRLWSCSGMGFALGTYTVTTPGSLPARITDNGIGVEAFVENFVAAGAASGTLTLNYTNANTGASKAGVIAAVVSAPVAGQMQPIPLVSGDTGVRAVVSAVTNATWTSGSFGITLLKRIAQFPVLGAALGTTYDWAQLAIPTIPNDACLFLFFQAANTTAPVAIGSIAIIDK